MNGASRSYDTNVNLTGATGAGGILAQKTIERALTPQDLGIEGTVRQLRGTFSLANGLATVRVDWISGNIMNPFQVVQSLMNTAREAGADRLRIEALVVNPRLLNILVNRMERLGLESKE